MANRQFQVIVAEAFRHLENPGTALDALVELVAARPSSWWAEKDTVTSPTGLATMAMASLGVGSDTMEDSARVGSFSRIYLAAVMSSLRSTVTEWVEVLRNTRVLLELLLGMRSQCNLASDHVAHIEGKLLPRVDQVLKSVWTVSWALDQRFSWPGPDPNVLNSSQTGGLLEVLHGDSVVSAYVASFPDRVVSAIIQATQSGSRGLLGSNSAGSHSMWLQVGHVASLTLDWLLPGPGAQGGLITSHFAGWCLWMRQGATLSEWIRLVDEPTPSCLWIRGLSRLGSGERRKAADDLEAAAVGLGMWLRAAVGPDGAPGHPGGVAFVMALVYAASQGSSGPVVTDDVGPVLEWLAGPELALDDAHGLERRLDTWMEHTLGSRTTDQVLLDAYRRAMWLFESVNAPELTVRFARAALGVAESQQGRDEVNGLATMLGSAVFRHSLAMGDAQGAYEALNALPDPEVKNECVRVFVMTLWEQGAFDSLTKFPFVGLADVVERTLLSKARAAPLGVGVGADLDTGGAGPSFYEVLYGYHVTKGNLRAAAVLMYEYAQRLTFESSLGDVDAVSRVAQAYLACLSALELVDPAHAWLVVRGDGSGLTLGSGTGPVGLDGVAVDGVPLDGISDEQGESSHLAKRKRGAGLDFDERDGEEADEGPSSGVRVVKLADVKQSYAIAAGRIALVVAGAISPGTGLLSADDTLSLLLAAELYHDAVSLARAFDLDLGPVYGALALRAITAGASDGLDGGLDGLAEEADAREAALWTLIRELLEAHDKSDNGWSGHQVVAEKLLSYNRDIALPRWFSESYSRVDASGLLRVALKYGSWSLATELVHKMLANAKAAIGNSDPKNKRVQYTSWIPYELVQAVLEGMDREPGMSGEELRGKVNGYLEKANSIGQVFST